MTAPPLRLVWHFCLISITFFLSYLSKICAFFLTFHCALWENLANRSVVSIASMKTLLFVCCSKRLIPASILCRDLSFIALCLENSLLVNLIRTTSLCWPSMPSSYTAPTFRLQLSFQHHAVQETTDPSHQHCCTCSTAVPNSPCVAHRHGQWMQHCPVASNPALSQWYPSRLPHCLPTCHSPLLVQRTV